MPFFIIPTSTTAHLAEKIKQKRDDVSFVFPELNKSGFRYFPDGEVYAKISRARQLQNKKVIVLHSGMPKPNEGLVELELILQILKDNGIKPAIFFTYFPYSMQDKVFEKGETNIAESLIEKLVNYYKTPDIYIIDPHFGGRKWVKKYPITTVSAIPLLMAKAKQETKENILFLSSDKGGKRRTGISGMEKKRLNSFTVEVFSSNLNLKGKTAGIIDDLIETGGTLLKCYDAAAKKGAKNIIALITHGILPEGVAKIKNKYSKLYLTNTINQKEANVDISSLIVESISKKKHF